MGIHSGHGTLNCVDQDHQAASMVAAGVFLVNRATHPSEEKITPKITPTELGNMLMYRANERQQKAKFVRHTKQHP
jgi:hypothetical protein